jgi:two-component system alkaline phosphatase synthesis response regulator PhoP
MMKILLVDDDTFLRDMYATKFIECGHTVVTAVHAPDAIRILEQEGDFELIIVDMIMPGMTGIELMTELRRLQPNADLKFIVLSNQGQDQDIEEAKAAGAIGYIIKAQSIPSEVVKRVEEIISKQK